MQRPSSPPMLEMKVLRVISCRIVTDRVVECQLLFDYLGEKITGDGGRGNVDHQLDQVVSAVEENFSLEPLAFSVGHLSDVEHGLESQRRNRGDFPAQIVRLL